MNEAGPAEKSFHLPQSFRHFLPDMEYHTEHIRVQLKVDLEAQTIEGSCSLKIATTRSAGRVLRFHAVGFQIGKVELDGSEARFDHDGRGSYGPACSPGRKRKSHTIRVDYAAKPTRASTSSTPTRSTRTSRFRRGPSARRRARGTGSRATTPQTTSRRRR